MLVCYTNIMPISKNVDVVSTNLREKEREQVPETEWVSNNLSKQYPV
jgi:hypothetical protein